MLATTPREEPLELGCLRLFLAYAGVALALAALRALAWGEPWWVGLLASAFGGLFVFVGLAFWWSIRDAVEDRALVRRALRSEALRDGRRMAVVGSLEPVGDLLRAPFTGRPCVAYWYDVSRHGRSSDQSDRRFYWGWHQAAASVNGDHGSLRVLGYLPEPAWNGTLTHDQAFRNAAAYLQATRPNVTLSSDALAPAVDVDDPASLRRDIARSEPGIELASLKLREYVLESGSIVCVIGRYSADSGGLVRDRQRLQNGLELLVGQPTKVLRDLRQRATGRLLVGGLFVGLGLMVAMLSGT